MDSSHHFEDAIKHFSEHGIEIKGEVNIDFKKMIERKAQVVEQTTKGIDFLMGKNNIEVFHCINNISIIILFKAWTI